VTYFTSRRFGSTGEVRWDGFGDDGKRVKQGVYFLRASIGASSKVSRIVYLPN